MCQFFLHFAMVNERKIMFDPSISGINDCLKCYLPENSMDFCYFNINEQFFFYA